MQSSPPPSPLPALPSGRLVHVDIARALGIALVILGHALVLFVTRPVPFDADDFRAVRFIYSFHMPLFFLLSGLMHRPRGPAGLLGGSLALVFLALLTQLVGVSVDGLIGGDWPSPYDMVRSLVLLTGFSLGVTWFLVALAVVRLLASLWLQGGRMARVVVMVAAAASLLLALRTEFRAFQIQAWWAGLLFYLAGQALASALRGGWVQGRQPLLALGAAAALVVTALAAAGNHGCLVHLLTVCGSDAMYGHFMVRMIVGDYGFLPLFLLAAAAGSLGVLLLSMLLARLLPGRALAFLGWVGANTLALLLLNGLVLLVGNELLRPVLAGGYRSWLAVLLPLAMLAGHVLLLPLAIPVVGAAERLCTRAARGVIARLPVPPLWPDPVHAGDSQATMLRSEAT